MLFYRIIMKRILNYFTKFEIALWTFSVLLILASYLVFGGEGWLSAVASLIGVTSLVLSAKGNPIGPLLMIIFSILYGIISYTFSYYGEMITYLGMSLPMSVLALVSWLRNPYKDKKSEVTASRLTGADCILVWIYTAVVTAAFYFILEWLGTKNLIISTVSVATSFLAAYLTYRRSPYFALAYAANDLVLILMWILASAESAGYTSVVVCFVIFLVNDLYGFLCWLKRLKRQGAGN